jgi:hypothetical protein
MPSCSNEVRCSGILCRRTKSAAAAFYAVVRSPTAAKLPWVNRCSGLCVIAELRPAAAAHNAAVHDAVGSKAMDNAAFYAAAAERSSAVHGSAESILRSARLRRNEVPQSRSSAALQRQQGLMQLRCLVSRCRTEFPVFSKTQRRPQKAPERWTLVRRSISCRRV